MQTLKEFLKDIESIKKKEGNFVKKEQTQHLIIKKELIKAFTILRVKSTS